MVSDLYVFNMETFVWEMVTPAPEDDIPEARYFHSTEACELSRLLIVILHSCKHHSTVREQSPDRVRRYGRRQEIQ